MKIVIDNKIPYMQGVFEPFADTAYYAPEEITAESVRDADVLLVRTRTRCDERLLRGSRVRYIGTATIGYDHIDAEWCRRNGIVWTNAPGCNASSVGQYVLSSLLSLQEHRGRNLSASVIGIVGVGHVGRIVERYCRAFGMEVLLCDPPRSRQEPDGGFVSLDTIARRCDIITFHTPLTPEGPDATWHLADRAFFARVAREPVILNAARGAVVDNRAMYAAWREGRISDMILDCWEDEPCIDAALLSDVFIGTPHIAGYSADGKANASRQMVEAVNRWLHIGADVARIVPPEPACAGIDLTAFPFDGRVRAVLSTYCPLDDTEALRRSPADFEKLRGNYGLRREFGAYTLSGVCPADVPVLRELGFNIG
ncbi:MAG: 4-phosphoerythronate dehydrogenase PdxB [Coprobacter sp.]|nr:4-phosphoerythronate dehydrogenase PdxB [Coprobacter sp.]